MNLVSQILTDLEKRGLDAAHRSNAILRGLQAPRRTPHAKEPGRWIVPVAALVLGTGLAWRLDGLEPSSRLVTEHIAAVETPTITVPDKSAENNVVSANRQQGLLPELAEDNGYNTALQDSSMGPLDYAVAFSSASLDATGSDPRAGPKSSMHKTARPLSSKEKATQHTQRAFKLLRQGDQGRAEQYLRQALEADSSHVPACTSLAVLLLNANRLDEAAHILGTGRESAPQNLQLTKLHARVLIGQQKLADADKILQETAQFAVKDPEFHGLRAAIRLHQGDLAGAAEHYRQALVLQPDQSAWWIGFGTVMERAEQPRIAQKAYKRALQSPSINEKTAADIRTKIEVLTADQS